MIPCRFLLSAALAAGTLAGCGGHKPLGPPMSPDRAAATCREKIVTAYASPTSAGTLIKIGSVEPLHKVEVYGVIGARFPNARLYKAQVQVTNILGMKLDRYDVCFFDPRGNAYHFITICHTVGLSSRFEVCS